MEYAAFLVWNKHKSDDQERQNLIYDMWVAANYYQRVSFPYKIKEHQKKAKNDKKLLEKKIENIKNNPNFKSYNADKQKTVLKNLKRSIWRDRYNSWKKIANLAGYSEANSKYFYSLHSDRVHSGNLTVMQVYQAKDNKDRMQLAFAPLYHLLINISFMIKFYCDYFEKSKQFYLKKYKEPNLVLSWVQLGTDTNINSIFDI